jgi:ACS family tartrate transporter-like MFS transporter
MPEQQAAAIPPQESEELSRGALRRVAWRLIPVLGLLYLLNILDRANVGFARLTMQDDLGMSKEVFDRGYGLFYFGYLLFEVPSNLLLGRVGARRWIARIMITWGLVSCATMLVRGAWGFYLVRVLLGVAEAGFFPGIILYLTYWFPSRERARVVALFMIAGPIAGLVGNPVSGAILEYMEGRAGLAGWQWLFLLEGLPSVLVGFAVFRCLTDRPEQADWMPAPERDWLVGRLAEEERHLRHRHLHGADFLRAMVDGRVWLLIAVYFTVAVGANASGAYLALLVQNRFAGSNKFEVGLLTALPHLCAMAVMICWSVHSDRTGERRGHVAGAAFLAAAGWSLAELAPSPGLALAGFCLAQAGMMSMLPTFWALPPSFLSGAAAAGGIALINSVANIGGLLGPTILGEFGLPMMTAVLCTGGALALCVRPEGGSEQRSRLLMLVLVAALVLLAGWWAVRVAHERGRWARALADPSPAVRAWAVRRIPWEGNQQLLTKALEDEDRDVRQLAAMRLGGAGPRGAAAARALVGLLKDEQPSVRWEASWSLALIGPDTWPAIREALADEDPRVRAGAARALLDAYRQHDVKTDNRDPPWPSRYAEDVAPALAELLHDKDPEVRHTAEKALKRIGR